MPGGTFKEFQKPENKAIIESALDQGLLSDPKDFTNQKEFEDYFKKGGRVGFQTGGWADDLTGQAAAIYQSMNLGGHSDQTIQDTLRSLGYWDGNTGDGGDDDNIINTQPSIIPGANREGSYPGQTVDKTSFADYQFNQSDYGPGGKLEINPAALGIGFYESGAARPKQTIEEYRKEILPKSPLESTKGGFATDADVYGKQYDYLSPVAQNKYGTKTDYVNQMLEAQGGETVTGPGVKEKGFMESFLGAAVPNKMKSTVTMPGHQQFGPVNPSEFRNFMDANIEGIGGNLTRQDLANMYEDYSKFKGRGSRYKDARVPGTVGNLFGMIPGFGAVKRFGEGIFGPQGDRSMQSTYGVANAGYGNTTFRDEFGLSVIDDNKRIFGKRDRDYLDRMEEQMGKNVDFFGGTRTSLFGGKKLDKKGSSVKNFAERWSNFDDLDAADQQALINEMKAINSFKAKQMLAYKNRIATEKINKDWQQKQEDIATKKRIDAEKKVAQDFMTKNPNYGNQYDPSKDHSGDGGYGHTASSPGATTGSTARSRHSRSSDLGFSDIRLKDNVELIGQSPSNINIYKFNYLNDPTVYQGVMAHEVPWASVKHSSGYMMVDYNQIDVQFKLYNVH